MKTTLTTLFFLIIISMLSCRKDTANPPDNSSNETAYQIVTITSSWFNVSYLAPKTYIIEETSKFSGQRQLYDFGR